MSVDPNKDEWLNGVGFGELISEPAKPRCFRWETPRDPQGLPMVGAALYIALDGVTAWGMNGSQLEVLATGAQYQTSDTATIARWVALWEVV